MAEFINANDSLNDGRKKLNKSIEQSERAEKKSDQAIADSTEALSTSESVRSELDQVVIDGDSSVEAAQARVGSDGTIYPTLKARNDAEHQKVTSQLAQTEQELNNRVSETIANAGDGTLPTEVVDMRTINNKTYTVAGDALRAISNGEGLTDKSITPLKISDSEIPLNEILTTPVIESNTLYSLLTGEPSPSSEYDTYVYSGLKPGIRYVGYDFYSKGGVSGYVHFFDASGSLVGMVNAGDPENPNGYFEVPEGVSTVKRNVRKNLNLQPKIYGHDYEYGYYLPKLIINQEQVKTGVENHPLSGKTINALGDSITSTDYTTPNWWQMISTETGATFNNYGESSTSLAHHANTHDNRNGCMVERYTVMDKNADGVILMGGTNDNGVPVGSWDSSANDTFFGALNILLQGLLNDYYGKPIIVMTPIQPATDYATNVPNPTEILLSKASTDTLTRQLRAEAIRLKCNQYGVTCIDLYNQSGINGADLNRVYYRPGDYLHPSAIGQKTIKNNLLPVLTAKFS